MKDVISVDKLRDIIGCTCSFNETYDGKSYNLKTEQRQALKKIKERYE